MGTVMMLSHVAAFAAVLGAVAAQASSGSMEPAAAEEQDSLMPRSYEWGDDDVPWGYGHIIHPGRGYYGYPRPYSGVGKYHPRHGQLSPAHADQPSVKLPEHVPGAAVSEMAQPGRYTVVSADGVPLEASEGKKAEPEKAAKDEKKEEVKEEEPAMNATMSATKDEEVHKVNNSEVNRAGEMPGGQPLNETKASDDSQPAEYHPTPVPSKASSATALERATANFSAQNSTEETDEAPKQKANDETEAPKVENATEAPKVENATEAPKVEKATNQNANKDPAPEANATSNATSDTISNTTAPVPDENPSPNVTSNASSSDNDNSSRASNASKSANEKEEQTAGATMGEKDRATKSKEQSNDVSAALASKATNELPKDAPAPKELSSELPTDRSQATHAPATDATTASKPEQATPASTQAQSTSHAVDEVKADVKDIKSADKTQSKADEQITADTSKATDQFKADLSSKIKSMQK